MRIAHISDLHIRNFKYRDEYREAFDDLYRQLDDLKPDLVINTGDTVHSKLAVSPELFDDVAHHCIDVCSIAPYWIILGNHDLNLKNKSRTDAISPIVRALQGRTANELRMPQHFQLDVPERFRGGQFREFAFWHYDIRKQRDEFVLNESDINIGLYHGSISGCQTDMGFVMEEGESEVSKFDMMDYVLMGDIHKRQSFRGGRMQYPGSLIQQNYGEELVKGFLLWDIRTKDDFSVDFHEVKTSGRFYTVQVPKDFDLSGLNIPHGSRIRARLEGDLSPSRRIELEKLIIERFKPIEVITPDSSGESSMEELDLDRLVPDRAKMMDDHLTEKGATEEQKLAVRRLFREFEAQIDDVGQGRGTVWSLKNIQWDNMMNYGEGNGIDFTKLSGLVGIFAPNASGKSTIFDIMLEALFDKVSKEVPRNIDLINDNKDAALMNVEFEANGNSYFIERSIERITYGQRKLTETKQWGKTALDFAQDGESLNGTSRPETERHIRSIIGSFDDFVLTTMVTQNPIFGLPGGGDIINCKETDRRKILFKFLDLDIYERVNQLCREDLKNMLAGLKGQSREALEEEIRETASKTSIAELKLVGLRSRADELESVLTVLREKLAQSGADDVQKLELEKGQLESDVAKAEQKLRSVRGRLQEIENAQKMAQDRLEKLVAAKIDYPVLQLDEVASELQRLQKRRQSLSSLEGQSRERLKASKKAMETLKGIPCEGKFPTCKFISDALGMGDVSYNLEEAITTLSKEAAGLDTEIEGLRAFEVHHKAAAKWEKDVADARLNAERYNGRVSTAEAEVRAANEVLGQLQAQLKVLTDRLQKSSYEEISNMKAQIKLSSCDLTKCRAEIDQTLKFVGNMEATRASKEHELTRLDEAQRNAKNYELLADMTGKTGLPYRILTRVLPVINHEIARILTGVTKFSVFFENDEDSQSVGLFIRYADYKSRPLGLGSGAEKFIASIAIRCALLSVSSLPKTDILIIDEGFGKLDAEHLEALQRMFEYLKESFGTVFIISHVDFMRDIVDHSVEISSRDGYAHVSVT